MVFSTEEIGQGGVVFGSFTAREDDRNQEKRRKKEREAAAKKRKMLGGSLGSNNIGGEHRLYNSVTERQKGIPGPL